MLFLYNAKSADPKQFVYALFTQPPQKTAACDCSQAAVIEAWTSLGLNQGPPDYESERMIFYDFLY